MKVVYQVTVPGYGWLVQVRVDDEPARYYGVIPGADPESHGEVFPPLEDDGLAIGLDYARGDDLVRLPDGDPTEPYVGTRPTRTTPLVGVYDV